jgi:uncharacterized protein
MNTLFASFISSTLQLPVKGITNTIQLLEDGATIPFISRYRKERTGGLNEVQIGQIEELYSEYRELEKRKESILHSLSEQGQLNDNLQERIDRCWNKNELEDIYLPYKPKRHTRAQKAREKGLEPLAEWIKKEAPEDPEQVAQAYLNDQVCSSSEALKGAMDILAEWVSEQPEARQLVRKQFSQTAILQATVIKGKEVLASTFQDYFPFFQTTASLFFPSIPGGLPG